MQINWLQDFLALAEIRHFTRAAERRSISQAAFSRRIKSLEVWLGTELFDRTGSEVSLTLDGRLFEQEARSILQRINITREHFAGAGSPSRQSITISMSQTVATTSFPKLWKQWSFDQKIDVVTRIGNVSDAVADFLIEYSEILVCHRSKQDSVLLDMKNFHSHVVQNDRFVPVVGTDTELLQTINRKRNWENIPLIKYTPNRHFSRLMNSLIEQAPFQVSGPDIVVTEMSDVVSNCVAQGLGIGWLPQSVVDGRPDITIIDEPSLSMDLEIMAFTRKKQASQPTHEIWKAICNA